MYLPKIKIVTFGCASNQADSNIMKNILSSVALVGDFDFSQAEYVIVNSCSVKGPTENKVIDFIKTIPLPKYAIIICGCLVSDKKKKKEFKDYSLVSPYNVTRIGEVINFLEKNKKPIHLLGSEKNNKLANISAVNGIAIIPILIGCLGACTYCKTKQAKPRFFSYPQKEIIKTISRLIKKGCHEIWLSSEDNGAYGVDFKSNYLGLLKEIEKKFKDKNVMFRFGMANPEHIYKYLKETKTFFENTNCFYKFLHIPIQSANDSVLKKMNRKYNNKKIEKISSELNGIVTLSTDIICGFPTETEKQFDESYIFIKKHKPLIVNVSQFWVRPFTKAQEMKQLSSEIKKTRSTKLSSLQKGIIKSGLSSYLGKTIEVYVDEYKTPFFWGRTRNYILVKINSKKPLSLGKWKKFKVKGIESNHLVV